MEKFFIAVANNANPGSGKFGNGGQCSGRYQTRIEAEDWAKGQIKNGRQGEFVIFEALCTIRCNVPIVEEELKMPLLPGRDHPMAEAAE